MNMEYKFLNPLIVALLFFLGGGGGIVRFAHFGGILAHFAIDNGQKWGDKSFMLLARIKWSFISHYHLLPLFILSPPPWD